MAQVQKERDFDFREVLNYKWVKIGPKKAVLLTFDSDGMFNERDLFNEHDRGITGQWDITDGYLELKTKWEGRDFVLLVGASSREEMHDGLENGKIAYKLIRVM